MIKIFFQLISCLILSSFVSIVEISADEFNENLELETIIYEAIKDPNTYAIKVKDKLVTDKITAANFAAHIFFYTNHNLRKLQVQNSYNAFTFPREIFITDNFISAALHSKEKEQKELLASPMFTDSNQDWILFVKPIKALSDFEKINAETEKHYNFLNSEQIFISYNLFKLRSPHAALRINLPGETLPNLLPAEFAEDLDFIYTELFKLLSEKATNKTLLNLIESKSKTKLGKILSLQLINNFIPNKCSAKITLKVLANDKKKRAGINTCLHHNYMNKQCASTDSSGSVSFKVEALNSPNLPIKISLTDNLITTEHLETIECNLDEKVFYFSNAQISEANSAASSN